MDYAYDIYNSLVYDYLGLYPKPKCLGPFQGEKVQDIIKHYHLLSSQNNAINISLDSWKECVRISGFHLEKLRALSKSDGADVQFINNLIQKHENMLDKCQKHISILSKYKKQLKMIKKTPKNNNPEDDSKMCAICEELPITRALGCGHTYCKTCPYKFSTCPICRKDVIHADIREIYF